MTKLKRKNAFALLLILTTLTVSAFVSGKTDLSRVYSRNNNECSLSPGLSINSIPTEYRVMQTTTQVEITRTQRNGAGEVSTFTETVKLDGTVAETPRPNGNVRKSSARLSANGDQLVETSTLVDTQGNVKQTSVLTFEFLSNTKRLHVKCLLTFDGEQYEWSGLFDPKQN